MKVFSINWLVACGVCGCLFVASAFTPGRCDTVFFDDFSDGSVTNGVPLDRDGNPVVWTPIPAFVGSGTGDASSGDFVLSTTPDGVYGLAASPLNIGDTSIRTRMQFLEGTPGMSLLGRGDPIVGNAYEGGINTSSGNAYIGRDDGFSYTNLASAPAPVDWSAGNISIQFDIIGEALSLYVWNVGEQKPAQPFLEATDSTYSSGMTGLLQNPLSGGASTSVFRFVHVADSSIPEPSSIVLAVATLTCLGAVRSTGRFARRAIRD